MAIIPKNSTVSRYVKGQIQANMKPIEDVSRFSCVRNFFNLMKQVVKLCGADAGPGTNTTEAAVLLLVESNAKAHSEFVCLGAAASDYIFNISPCHARHSSLMAVKPGLGLYLVPIPKETDPAM